MSQPARACIYVGLMALGLTLTPPHIFLTTLYIAITGLSAIAVLHLRARRTARTGVDEGLAWLALWAVAAVLLAPVVPLWHAFGDFVKGVIL